MTPVEFKTATDLQKQALEIVRRLEEDKSGMLQIVITKNGKPVAIMQSVKEEDFPNIDKPYKPKRK